MVPAWTAFIMCAGRRADEPCFEIGEPDVVGLGICADRDRMAAVIKRLIGISSSWDVVVPESTLSKYQCLAIPLCYVLNISQVGTPIPFDVLPQRFHQKL